jgi:hypothetical protein
MRKFALDYKIMEELRKGKLLALPKYDIETNTFKADEIFAKVQ